MMDLSSIARVEGPNLTLRLIQPEDAAYVTWPAELIQHITATCRQ